MTVEIIHGDARDLPLEDDSVDLIVTSPPYFGLRSYTDGGEHYDGQIGAEATPAEYVDALIDCTREWMRVLKPEGNLWVNLGDKYSTGNGGDQHLTNLGQRLGTGGGQKQDTANRRTPRVKGLPPKTLLGIPWRYGLRCLDELGLIIRAEVIWSKPNGLPESVTDRVRRSHEQWFHFTMQPRYFSAVDEVREAHSPHTSKYYPAGGGKQPRRPYAAESGRGDAGGFTSTHPLGKLPGSVWEVATQPLKVPAELGVDHYAAFPLEWPLRLIKGWSPSGICTACGEGRRPSVDRGSLDPDRVASISARRHCRDGTGGDGQSRRAGATSTARTGLSGQEYNALRSPDTITGYVCACAEPDAPTRPAVVLDPCGGTGTTALAADVLGRHGISVDMSADYCRVACWRTSDPGERAKAMGVPKPAPVMDGQTSLFDHTAITGRTP